MNFFIRNIELILAGLGIIVMFLVPSLLFYDANNLWKFVAIAGVIVTIVHGILLWTIRYRQRTIRKEVIEDVRSVLTDRINNNLTKISIGLHPVANNRGEDDRLHHVNIIQESVNEISRLLDNLSEDELDIWKNKYLNNKPGREK